MCTNGVCPLPSGALTMDGPLPHTATLALTELHSCKPISHVTTLDLSILHPLAHETFSRLTKALGASSHFSTVIKLP
ncbi:unnamed protein product [Sphagnum balticum]